LTATIPEKKKIWKGNGKGKGSLPNTKIWLTRKIPWKIAELLAQWRPLRLPSYPPYFMLMLEMVIPTLSPLPSPLP
jgi:hypothetical protein